ncbi:GntR family transcriptional regulator [Rhizobium sp. KVB221]|uniref:GntR family transcriptional regulator n=2 Tax=Rhizobium setariae TaxID=2801340 RepID=A0A937CJW4_9HYPH|nr:GntR family transcriptional regulator [Rhizobium setariae]
MDDVAGPGIGRDEPIYATIYAVLRDHLDNAKLRPGLVLGQANVARAFNVSRVPAGVALSRLVDEGLLHAFKGRGYIVPGAPPHRGELREAGLRIPAEVAAPSANRREQIYPEVEHAVAACLAYGRFMLNETALANHYDVSRTIAHEVLTQLERAGVIEQDSNNRWYAGPLTASDLHNHYEMRWLLEPQALLQAYPMLNMDDIRIRADRVDRAASNAPDPLAREELEADLHLHTLAPCPNILLLNVVRRSQRILIATHSTFEGYQRSGEIELMVSEHRRIYQALLSGDPGGAAATLERHLRRSLQPNLNLLERLGPLPENLCPPFLAQVRSPSS